MRSRHRKFTEFRYSSESGIVVKVPVWIIQNEEAATFSARLDELDIDMKGSDINALHESVGAEVKKKTSLKWTPYFYLAFSTRYVSKVQVEGILKGVSPDGTAYWLNVALPSDLETGDIERLIEWRGGTKIGGARPTSNAPKTGETYDQYSRAIVTGYSVLLPVTGESISHIRKVLTMERVGNALLMEAVKDADTQLTDGA